MRAVQRRVVAYLGQAGECSRAELGEALGLPKGTVAGVVAGLVELGIVVERPAAPGPRAAGRPARVVALAGAGAAVGVVTVASGRVRVSVATLRGEVLGAAEGVLEPTAGQATAVEVFAGLIESAAARAGAGLVTGLVAVVVGVGSPVPPPGGRGSGGAGRRWEFVPVWLDGALAAAVRARTGVEALVENDANLAALGEWRFGAGRGRSDVVLLKLGERAVGAGLILGGRLIRGRGGFAGELAHVQVRADGPVCSCGGRGCLLHAISTELLELAQPAYDERLTFASVLRLAAAGDIGLQRLLADVGRLAGRPLADLCTLLDPEIVVVDGSVGAAGAHIVHGVAETIERHASPAMAAAVVAGELAERADVFGAAALLRHEWSRSEV
ncbi:ROK family transcriptional regulator [Dactylosporangium sp. NPDC000244]|uniref:ROK family transcriptional regulator n=1 Tax=Dactylosporangium sp. NPDC000244 TaxID=3154365 RepID=UPI00331E31D6